MKRAMRHAVMPSTQCVLEKSYPLPSRLVRVSLRPGSFDGFARNLGRILSTGNSCMMFSDPKNVTFVEILLRPSFSTKSAGMPGFYRVKFGRNKISIKFTFLESGNIIH